MSLSVITYLRISTIIQFVTLLAKFKFERTISGMALKDGIVALYPYHNTL